MKTFYLATKNKCIVIPAEHKVEAINKGKETPLLDNEPILVVRLATEEEWESHSITRAPYYNAPIVNNITFHLNIFGEEYTVVLAKNNKGGIKRTNGHIELLSASPQDCFEFLQAKGFDKKSLLEMLGPFI